MSDKFSTRHGHHYHLWMGVAMGVVSSGTLMQVQDYAGRFSSRVDRDSMRSDWLRVGEDFDAVMASEHAKATTPVP